MKIFVYFLPMVVSIVKTASCDHRERFISHHCITTVRRDNIPDAFVCGNISIYTSDRGREALSLYVFKSQNISLTDDKF